MTDPDGLIAAVIAGKPDAWQEWAAHLDRLITGPDAADRAAALSDLERRVDARLAEPRPPEGGGRRALGRLWFDVRVARSLLSLGANGPAPPAERRGAIVDALLEYAEDRLRGMSSAVLREHFPRLASQPSNLTTTVVAQQVRGRLLRALGGLTPNDLSHFLRVARRHVVWQLLEWGRSRWRRPAPADLSGGPTPAAGAGPDAVAEVTAAIAAAREGLPEGERDLFDAVFDADTELAEIAQEFYAADGRPLGDVDLAVSAITELLMRVGQGIAARLGWTQKRLYGFLRGE